MSYDEHKEARLELADLHREWRIECDLRQTAQQIATDATRRAEAAEADVVIPRDVLTTLFRALVYADPARVTREQVEQAWTWLEQHNHHEEMGQ